MDVENRIRRSEQDILNRVRDFLEAERNRHEL
nr:MAG TPA: hypothetical protein [Caudoviricetes sp.]